MAEEKRERVKKEKEELYEIVRHIVGKGRIALWLSMVSIGILCAFGRIPGDQALRALLELGLVAVTGEAAIRKE